MRTRPPRRPSDPLERGFSLPELLVVLLLAGLMLGAATAAWQNYRRQTNAQTAGQTLKMSIHQARLLAIYRGVNHFVAIDPSARTVGIYEDTGLPLGSFDSGDTLVSETTWENGVALDLPQAPSPLARPLGGGNVAAAWDLPQPDTSALWGTTLKGLLTTPDGRILSAAATPALIGTGTIVLNDGNTEERTVGIAVEGLSGTVRAYRLNGSSWEEL